MTTHPAPFRSFELEIGEALGWTDGSSLNVVEHMANDGMVFYHERIHGVLINTTNDGKVLKVLNIAGPRLADRQHADELYRASQYLFKGSCFAHECCATYLGIMQLPTELERTAALSRLPSEYRTYYDFMSAIVDHKCKSSYLRYVIALSIGHFWFSSDATSVFANARYSGAVLMKEEFCPDWRARASAQWLAHSGVDAAVAASIEAILANTDLRAITQISDALELARSWDDDSWWIDKPHQVVGFIEEIISATAFHHFLENSGLCSAKAELIENTDLHEPLLKGLYDLAGVPIKSINSDRRVSPYADISPSDALRAFSIVVKTVSHIQPRLTKHSQDANKVLGISEIDTFVEKTNIVDIVFPEDESSDIAHFSEFFPSAGELGQANMWKFSGYGSCRSQVACEVVRRILSKLDLDRPGMQFDCIVLPMSFEDDAIGSSLRLPSLDDSLIGEIFKSGRAKSLFLYVRDDWEKVVGQFGHARPATHIGTTYVNIAGRELISLNVARLDGFDATLLKAYPAHAMPMIDNYYNSCIEQGYLHRLEDQSYGPALLNNAKRALVAITSFWHTL